MEEKKKTEVKHTKISKTSIEEEVDKELYKTHTLNLAGTHKLVIV